MAVLGLLLISAASALRFYLPEGSEHCFVLDYPVNTVILGKYNLMDRPADTSQQQGVQMTVTNPNSLIITQRFITADGKFSIAIQELGKHRLCLKQTGPSWATSKKLRFDISLDTGDDEIDHDHIASKGDVLHLQEIALQVIERSAEVIKQQEHNRGREEEFQNASDVVHGRVLWFTIVQTGIIIIAGIWQIISLRSFIISRKLV
mmetsp:Transcript_21928/g.40000  ORF Transcript_21928/g.40000 Transcript_21928/m.40000 type:complete len:205 (+) Transcript_21928:360-974(+)|eukprot:CAMPEP_0204898948 /NCGR_PEP_ID=MMETSP1397-20131031/1567_1 /ASSEMBLY_ACC=CAM_ASM_000891 /TAXON_ID=49980 /ORGANISM="Climacostomum Climacostomum virens, Strain Stock W-24" /LENGTH=204 /DNA_ID=CAMNT_0052066843 /DNA_START=165 /DNA_END=779 /DNA_ORIENTATION=-